MTLKLCAHASCWVSAHLALQNSPSVFGFLFVFCLGGSSSLRLQTFGLGALNPHWLILEGADPI